MPAERRRWTRLAVLLGGTLAGAGAALIFSSTQAAAAPAPSGPAAHAPIARLLDPTVEKVVRPVTQDLVRPVTKPVVDRVVRPVVKPVADRVVRPVVKPVADRVVKPALADVVEPVLHPVVKRTTADRPVAQSTRTLPKTTAMPPKASIKKHEPRTAHAVTTHATFPRRQASPAAQSTPPAKAPAAPVEAPFAAPASAPAPAPAPDSQHPAPHPAPGAPVDSQLTSSSAGAHVAKKLAVLPHALTQRFASTGRTSEQGVPVGPHPCSRPGTTPD